MNPQIPEDLKLSCLLCVGGKVLSASFVDPSTDISKQCRVCKGTGWVWALDQQEMADRISTLTAQHERDQNEIASGNAALTILQEACERDQETIRGWLKENGPGGWIDHLREENARLLKNLQNGEQMYIAMRDRCGRIEEENARLKAPITDWQWIGAAAHERNPIRIAERIIASRAKGE